MTTALMKLRAAIKHVTGSKRRVAVMVGRGGIGAVPDPVALRVIPDGAGYSLMRLDASGASVAHTWHPTLDDAKAQAASEYGIADADWEEERA